MTNRAPRALLIGAPVALVAAAALVFYLVVRDSTDSSEVGGSDIGGSAPGDTYEVTPAQCRPAEQALMEGTITNTTDETLSYQLVVEFVWPDGRRFEGKGNATYIAPGDTQDWSAPVQGAPRGAPPDIECELVAVDTWEYD